MIEDFLEKQPIENRVIFMRRYWFADTYKDIAEQVGISEKMSLFGLLAFAKS